MLISAVVQQRIVDGAIRGAALVVLTGT